MFVYKTHSITFALLTMSSIALGMSSISTLAAGLAWLLISLAGLSAWLTRKSSKYVQHTTEGTALQAANLWLIACIVAFVLMAIPTAYWGGPWPERHPQWRLLIGALGLWLLLRYTPPTLYLVQMLATSAAIASLLTYGLIVTVGSDAAPTNRIPWMAGLSLLSCSLLSMSYELTQTPVKLRQFWLAASALMIVNVLLSGVRGSWPLIVVWPLLLWQLSRAEPSLWLTTRRWLLPLLAILCIAGLGLISEKNNPFLRVVEIVQETGLQNQPTDDIREIKTGSSGIRLGLYVLGITHVFDSPVVGVGPAYTKELIRKTLHDLNLDELTESIGHLHNDLLHAWLEFGLFGMSGYLAYAVGLALIGWTIHKKHNKPSTASGSLALLVMHFTTGLSNMNFAHNYYPVWLALSTSLFLLATRRY